jgi:hypothetical protein
MAETLPTKCFWGDERMRPLKTASQREKVAEALLVKKVQDMGGKAFKLASPMFNSLPDRLIVFRNKPSIYVEVKKVDGKLTTLQEKTQSLLQGELCQPSYVLYGKEGVLRFIESLPAILNDLPDIEEKI